jgi:topoisomerase IA-like protein
MEIISPYIGKYEQSSIFLNHGKYGPFLNYNDKLYSVPLCFQTPKFNLESAIKIIDFKNKWSESKKDELVKGSEDEEIIDIVKSIKNKKSLKKSNE